MEKSTFYSNFAYPALAAARSPTSGQYSAFLFFLLGHQLQTMMVCSLLYPFLLPLSLGKEVLI
jgi:hypothetical protein